MTEALTLPANAAAFVDESGRLTLAGRASLNQVLRELASRIDATQALLDAITSLEDGAANILASKADKSLLFIGSGSIDSGVATDLSENRVFQLEGDSETPGNSKFYGTNSSGTKGFHTVALTGVSGAGLGDYADDTAASAGGVAIGSLYRTGSTLKVRIA